MAGGKIGLVEFAAEEEEFVGRFVGDVAVCDVLGRSGFVLDFWGGLGVWDDFDIQFRNV